MATRISTNWIRCEDGEWAELFGLNPEQPHFLNLEGVFVLWREDEPKILFVGAGMVEEKLRQFRADPKLQALKPGSVWVTWARVDRPLIGGVLRYVVDALKPEASTPIGPGAQIETNLPGQTALPDSRLAQRPETSLPRQTRTDRLYKPAGPIQAGAARPAARPTLSEQKPGAAAGDAGNGNGAVDGRWYALQQSFKHLLERAGYGAGSAAARRSTNSREDDALVVDIVQLLLDESVRARASDIHLEPMDDVVRVRFRVDGMLQEILEIPNYLNLRVVSRVRVMGGLDPEQSISVAVPQDGRISLAADGKPVDIRLSTFPTTYGEKAVLRIIQRGTQVLSLSELGLVDSDVQSLLKMIQRKQGMIIVCGPTGAGKSTTLYTVLQILNQPTRNIVTLEDPIELKIRGINQGAILPKVGFTFAEGLRSILRQDPNVIMFGEIRDLESAEIAMRAALTGHLMMTTLHTSSALDAFVRLLDMGLEPYLVAAAITGVCAQQLARRICERCRKTEAPSPEVLHRLEALAGKTEAKLSVDGLTKISVGTGCDACQGTGTRGRILVFEQIALSPDLRRLILRKASLDEFREVAVKEGMRNLGTDAFAKLAAGLISPDELIRIIGI